MHLPLDIDLSAPRADLLDDLFDLTLLLELFLRHLFSTLVHTFGNFYLWSRREIEGQKKSVRD